ncbi:MAG: glucosaminidase domain-containing protein [Marinifilaceae bacterium]|nr:glucosaminidase domain-containing protein [Marinifilaceae bacterium]
MFKRSILLLLICCVVLSSVAQEHNHARRAYIHKYSELAVKEMKRTGVPASISLAQGILESNSGRSTLAVKAKNHFGIKCHDWQGKGFYMDDDAPNECFRHYDDVEESWRDHSDFLRTRPRYSFLFDLKATDYKGWAKGLKSAGYATSPTYAEKLIKIIEEEKLYYYDTKEVASASLYDPEAYPNRVEVINRVECIEARSGDSYEKIARYYGIKLKRILKFNDKGRDDLQPGDLVYLKSKRNRAAMGYPYCRVREGNTIYEISQKYGVKIKSIIKFNGYTPSTRLVPGEKVYLRSKPKKQ